jgi:hypothetical protein
MAEDSSENARRARPKDEHALKDEQIKRLKQKLGTDRPFGRGLSCGTSPRHRATGSWGRGMAGGGRPATDPPVRPSSGRS